MGNDFLVGSTGFVGMNLAMSHQFDGLFHSTNIRDACGARPDLLVYAGVRGEMFLANRDPEGDRAAILQAEDNIRQIAARRVVLVSTVAVYPDPSGVFEDTPIDKPALPPYGADRLELEEWVEENCPRRLIVRLPAVYGEGLKKNFLYDYLHVIPALLTEGKLAELSQREPALRDCYLPQGNGFCRCRTLAPEESKALRGIFHRLGFTALSFTDSRSAYQFYPLRRLWGDIKTALDAGLERVNLTAPPITAGEVYYALEGKPFRNELEKPPYRYDVRTRHGDVFGGTGDYVMGREEELRELLGFVEKKKGEIK